MGGSHQPRGLCFPPLFFKCEHRFRQVGANGIIVARTWHPWEVQKDCEVQENKDKKRSSAVRKKR